ncbi:MAG: carbohydrate ABC transporter permease [Chloroflexi bacterium]|nr:carbohydrate ABC transporter permease [Chloroflexota bacterium]
MAYRRRSRRSRIALEGLNVLAILFLTLPLVAVLFGSVQTERAILSDVTNPFPKEITLANFELLLGGGPRGERIFEQASYFPASLRLFPQAFGNSVVVATLVTLLTLVFGALAAYAVCRLPFRWTRGFMYANLASRMVPIVVLMVPLYVMLRRLGMLNSLSGIIITEVGLLLPYAIWILVAYFAAFPHELEDAARIDGCSRMGAFARVVLPLSAPGLAATGVIVFILSWHELLVPLIVASRPEVMTIPVILAGLVSDFYVFYTLMMAICLVGLLPTVLLVLALQRYVVRGLTGGALKG